ncbi:Recombination protein RecR [invertebrate metagenome]|uniref:Recombination protein RecR n=1 Tax=invertebrate metagenome TaxID=1711999 RepID=A0A484H725_9ZZZZ
MGTAIKPAIKHLIQILARLPGLGPRSARRAALALFKERTTLMEPLLQTLAEAAARVR